MDPGVGVFTPLPKKEDSEIQQLRDQIQAWTNLAAKLRQAERHELFQLAMERKRGYEKLAKLQEFEVDEKDT